MPLRSKKPFDLPTLPPIPSQTPYQRLANVWNTATSQTAVKEGFDLLLLCGHKLEEVRCHQAVLCGASSNISSLLQGQAVQTRDGSWVSSQATIILPDVGAGDMRRVLCVLYNGFAQVSVEAAQELKRVWKELGINIIKLSNKEKIEVVQLDAMGKLRGDRPFLEPNKEMEKTAVDKTTAVKTSVKTEPFCSLEETQPPSSMPQMFGVNRDDSDPDDPSYTPKQTGKAVKSLRGPASKRRTSAPSPSPTMGVIKKPKTEDKVGTSGMKPKTEEKVGKTGMYFVEEIHTCCLCHGRTKEGKTDKEALNLSFRELKKLRDHYSKHLYEEGIIQKYVPWGSNNTNSEGSIVDEFGASIRYSCKVPNCWRAKKSAVGYKEFAIHNATDHGVLEEALEDETRSSLVQLLERIRHVQEKEREATKPRSCLIPGCREKDVMHTNAEDYAGLKRHYSTVHWRSWFEKCASPDEGPRIQKVTDSRKGTVCDLCRSKVFGDKERMIEHYAVIHDRLFRGLLDLKTSGVGVVDSRGVVEQLFPDRSAEFERQVVLYK